MREKVEVAGGLEREMNSARIQNFWKHSTSPLEQSSTSKEISNISVRKQKQKYTLNRKKTPLPSCIFVRLLKYF